jgi:hypothetical protein
MPRPIYDYQPAKRFTSVSDQGRITTRKQLPLVEARMEPRKVTRTRYVAGPALPFRYFKTLNLRVN